MVLDKFQYAFVGGGVQSLRNSDSGWEAEYVCHAIGLPQILFFLNCNWSTMSVKKKYRAYTFNEPSNNTDSIASILKIDLDQTDKTSN